jgi:hypothetical protein
MDFGFSARGLWPDAELRGLEFLYDRPGLKAKWENFWPTGGGIHHWDAVGWLGTEPGSELLLLEAKAYAGELESDCNAKCPSSIQKIEGAFTETRCSLGVSPTTDWMRRYYQAANRVATLYFLHRENIAARLLFVYFLGDHFPGEVCPMSERDWASAIEAQWTHLGVGADHLLADRIHKLFLPVGG